MVLVAVTVAQLLLPETVYIVVVVGVAITELPVAALNPAVGDQLYVLAPVAVSVTVLTAQDIVPVVGVTAVVGKGFTVIKTLADALQVVTGSVTVQV